MRLFYQDDELAQKIFRVLHNIVSSLTHIGKEYHMCQSAKCRYIFVIAAAPAPQAQVQICLVHTSV